MPKMDRKSVRTLTSVRINCVITGEPAQWLVEWKQRGLVKSNSDAVRAAFRVLQERILEQDLQQKKLEASRL